MSSSTTDRKSIAGKGVRLSRSMQTGVPVRAVAPRTARFRPRSCKIVNDIDRFRGFPMRPQGLWGSSAIWSDDSVGPSRRRASHGWPPRGLTLRRQTAAAPHGPRLRAREARWGELPRKQPPSSSLPRCSLPAPRSTPPPRPDTHRAGSTPGSGDPLGCQFSIAQQNGAAASGVEAAADVGGLQRRRHATGASHAASTPAQAGLQIRGRATRRRAPSPRRWSSRRRQ